jgi:hypothetical protein
MTQEGKQVLDLAAASTGVMSLAAWLPPVASLFTIVWLGLREEITMLTCVVFNSYVG